MSYVSTTVRQLVTQRAREQCEYCRFPQTASLFAFEMEHIIAEKHDGITAAENLALSCPCCNRFKGTDLGSIDPETQQLTPFIRPNLFLGGDCHNRSLLRYFPIAASSLALETPYHPPDTIKIISNHSRVAISISQHSYKQN
jgi:HNH endonuclease